MTTDVIVPRVIAFTPLTLPRFTVDAMTPVEENMHHIEEYLGENCP